jgi:N-acetylglucosamine kinase-like BadF-type ATPase
MSADLLIGVDGGGTKTQAVAADLRGHVLARGLSGASNPKRVGLEKACAAITAAVDGALGPLLSNKTSVRPLWLSGHVAAACFGLAGIDSPEDEAVLSAWARSQGFAPVFSVVNDTELILAAGTPEGWGVALISGTGSNCIARSPLGQTLHVGGWGPILGDEGSGYFMAAQALRMATQAADGRGNATALLDMVLQHWSLRDPGALVTHVYRPEVTHADIASLADPVLDLAEAGDKDAARIVRDAARDLALQLETAIRRLGVPRPPLALAGAMLRRIAFKQAVLSLTKEALGPVTMVAQPYLGAVALAQRLLTPVAMPSASVAMPKAPSPGA